MNEGVNNPTPVATLGGNPCRVSPTSIDSQYASFLSDLTGCWLGDENRRSCVLNLMVLYLQRGDRTETFKGAMETHLSQCMPCLVQYINQRPRLGDFFRGQLKDKEILALEDGVEDWDKARLTKGLTSITERISTYHELLTERATCLHFSLTLLEMLSCKDPKLLRIYGFNLEALYRQISGDSDDIDIDLAHFVELLFHPSTEISQLTQVVIEIWPQPLPPSAVENLLANFPSAITKVPELLSSSRAQGFQHEMVSWWKSTLLALRMFPKSAYEGRCEEFLLPLCQAAMHSFYVDHHYDVYRDRCLVFCLVQLGPTSWNHQEGTALQLIERATALFMTHLRPELVYFETAFKDLSKLIEFLVRSCEKLAQHPQVVDGTIAIVFKMQANPQFRPEFQPKVIGFGLRLTEYALTCTNGLPLQSLRTFAPLYVSTMVDGHRRARDIVLRVIKEDMTTIAQHIAPAPLTRTPILELWSSLCSNNLHNRPDLYLLVLTSFECLSMLDREAISNPTIVQTLTNSPPNSYAATMAQLDSMLCDFLDRATRDLDSDTVQQLKSSPRSPNSLVTLLLAPSGAVREKLMLLLSKPQPEDLVHLVRTTSMSGKCQLASPLGQSLAILGSIIERTPVEAPQVAYHFQLIVSFYQDLFAGIALPADLVELLDSDGSADFIGNLYKLAMGVLAAGIGPLVQSVEAVCLSFKRRVASGKSSASIHRLFQSIIGLIPTLSVAIARDTTTSEFYCVAGELVESILHHRSQVPEPTFRTVMDLATALVTKLPESSRSHFEYRIKLLMGNSQPTISLPPPNKNLIWNDLIDINSDSDSEYLDLPCFRDPPQIHTPVKESISTLNDDTLISNNILGHQIFQQNGLTPVPKPNIPPVVSNNEKVPENQIQINQAGSNSVPSEQTLPPSTVQPIRQIIPPLTSNVDHRDSPLPIPLQSSNRNTFLPRATKQMPITHFTAPQKSTSILEPRRITTILEPSKTTTAPETKPLASIFTKNYPAQPNLESDPIVKTEHSPRVKEEPRGAALVEKIIAKATTKPTPIVNQVRQRDSSFSNGLEHLFSKSAKQLEDALAAQRDYSRPKGIERVLPKSTKQADDTQGEYPRPKGLERVLPKRSKQMGELTLATLPHLDPRIPKQANPILARSGSRAKQLLKKINVDQSSVKMLAGTANTSDGSSSSDDEEADAGGGLDQFLKESIQTNTSKPTAQRPAQSKPTAQSSTSSSDTDSSEVDVEGSSSSESDSAPQPKKSKLALNIPGPRPPPKVNKLMGTLIPTPAIPLGSFSFDIDSFDGTVLRWSCDAVGDLPVWFNATKPYCTQFRSILQIFRTVREYVEVLEPLFFLECWAQLQKAREEVFSDDAISCSVVNSQQAQNFLDITLKSNGGISQLSENDLLILTLPRPHDATQIVRVLAKMRRPTTAQGSLGIEIRCCLDQDRNMVLACLRPNVPVSVLKLTSMATMYRDYLALHGLTSYHLVKDIIEGRARGFDEPNPAKVQQLIKRHNLNKSQAEAIVATASKKEGFSLIQGPPGTGKTKTILGLVATLRQTSRRDPGQSNYWDKPQKLLICAPSNAAVDEIVRRLRTELNDTESSPKLIRVGISESINSAVQDQTLDYLVEANLRSKTSGEYQKAKEELDKFNAKIDALRITLKKHHAMREQLRDSAPGKPNAKPADTERYIKLKKQMDEISNQIDLQFQLRSASSRAMDAARYKVRSRLLNGADIICSTLSGAGHDMMQDMACDFDTVIIDEAAQSVELSSLIPLRFGCKRCIMIGDPHQLPPTVMSLTATKYGYNNSLFSRMFAGSNSTAHLLNVQYRMHPQISQLPSTLFYDGRLLDAPGLTESKSAPWHESPLFPPYHFYDVPHGVAVASRSHSLENIRECEAASAIVTRLFRDYPDINFKNRIAVISPYKGQIAQMRRTFSRTFGRQNSSIDFNTVDGFQGQEKDIIIFSCVRAGSDSGIGFLSDIRRMNVGLTRAQMSLFVVGRASTLSIDPHWKILVARAKELGQYSEINPKSFAAGNSNNGNGNQCISNGGDQRNGKKPEEANQGSNIPLQSSEPNSSTIVSNTATVTTSMAHATPGITILPPQLDPSPISKNNRKNKKRQQCLKERKPIEKNHAEPLGTCTTSSEKEAAIQATKSVTSRHHVHNSSLQKNENGVVTKKEESPDLDIYELNKRPALEEIGPPSIKKGIKIEKPRNHLGSVFDGLMERMDMDRNSRQPAPPLSLKRGSRNPPPRPESNGSVIRGYGTRPPPNEREAPQNYPSSAYCPSSHMSIPPPYEQPPYYHQHHDLEYLPPLHHIPPPPDHQQHHQQQVYYPQQQHYHRPQDQQQHEHYSPHRSRRRRHR